MPSSFVYSAATRNAVSPDDSMPKCAAIASPSAVETPGSGFSTPRLSLTSPTSPPVAPPVRSGAGAGVPGMRSRSPMLERRDDAARDRVREREHDREVDRDRAAHPRVKRSLRAFENLDGDQVELLTVPPSGIRRVVVEANCSLSPVRRVMLDAERTQVPRRVRVVHVLREQLLPRLGVVVGDRRLDREPEFVLTDNAPRVPPEERRAPAFPLGVVVRPLVRRARLLALVALDAVVGRPATRDARDPHRRTASMSRSTSRLS